MIADDDEALFDDIVNSAPPGHFAGAEAAALREFCEKFVAARELAERFRGAPPSTRPAFLRAMTAATKAMEEAIALGQALGVLGLRKPN